MPLYIRDPEVDQLTNELIGLTRTTKVEAVRDALKDAIALPPRLPWPTQPAPSILVITSGNPTRCGARTTDDLHRRLRCRRDHRPGG